MQSGSNKQFLDRQSYPPPLPHQTVDSLREDGTDRHPPQLATEASSELRSGAP